MEQEPKISVIIPSFNQGMYLEECINSVLAQEYSNLEFIIIDGISTDDSVDIIKQYSSKLDYWVSEPDLGQSDAINKGFRKSTGDLVAWLNADDYYLPDAFTAVTRAYNKDNMAPFYFGDGLRVDKLGKTIDRFFPNRNVKFDRSALLYGLNYILQPSTFINRKHLIDPFLLDADLHYGMDYDLWMRLSNLGKPQPIDVILSASREYDTTKTSTGSFKRVEELRGIVMKHSGMSITPGVMCYFLDTLHRSVEQDQDLFPKAYSAEILSFWQKTSELFEDFGARPDGFPKATSELKVAPPQYNQDLTTSKSLIEMAKRLIGLT